MAGRGARRSLMVLCLLAGWARFGSAQTPTEPGSSGAGSSEGAAKAPPPATTSTGRELGSKPRASSAPARVECRPHKAQEFLKRRSFVRNNMVDGGKNLRAIRWRTETYGTVPGVEGLPSSGSPASAHARSVRFMGLPIQVHEKIVEPLVCVERRIRNTCRGSKSYTPRAIGGFRNYNSYRQGEVSNHLFGIAVDVDPDKNPCCGCVSPWPDHPACKDPGRSAIEQSALPRCWIDAFERYGFYWLGRDELRDTMHFEYLGDPDRYKPKKKPDAVARDRKDPKRARGRGDRQAKGQNGKASEPAPKPAPDAERCAEPYPDPACTPPPSPTEPPAREPPAG